MKRIFALALALLPLASVTFAQDARQPAIEKTNAELFFGYSHVNQHYYNRGDNRENLHGWNLEVTGYLTEHVGITADMSGHYGEANGAKEVQTFYGLLGPTYKAHAGKFSPFARALFGATHPTSLGKGFAMSYGGGIDLDCGSNWSVRLIQGDYVLSRFAGAYQKNFRISTGILARW